MAAESALLSSKANASAEHPKPTDGAQNHTLTQQTLML